MRSFPGWRGLLAMHLLLCIGAGLVSIAVPGEPEPAGYYDGDVDDAVVVPERLATPVVVAVPRGPLGPTSPPTRLAVPAAPPRPRAADRPQPPPLRSPPA